ncbi:type VI secretion system baseplate subunit TssK [Lentisphaerota bacterium WC36G]|nr:type VI secretion system baseplate subunit TssK [Lentisphaerae bacterium WC36]
MKPDIFWEMGQNLYPVHFKHLQDSLSLKSFIISNESMMPKVGICEFNIDDEFLAINVVRVTKFQFISIEGHLMKLNVNATFCDFDLSEIAADSDEVTLYFNAYETETNYDEYEQASLNCVGYELKFSSEPLANALYSVKILKLTKELQTNWTLAYSFLPVAININVIQFNQLRSDINTMCNQIISNYIAMRRQKEFLQKAVEYKNVVAIAHRTLFALENAAVNHMAHPMTFYFALYELFVNLSLFLNSDIYKIPPYNHYDLYSCFMLLINKINELISLENQSVKFSKFVAEEKFMKIESLPDEIADAKEVFLVIQKKIETQNVAEQNIKLASPARFPILDQLALSGVSKQLVDEVPFRHYLSGSTLFFKLELGKEWEFIVKDKAVEFQRYPEYEDVNFYLYYY